MRKGVQSVFEVLRREKRDVPGQLSTFREIPPRRLRTLPTATHCVACQERRETAHVPA